MQKKGIHTITTNLQRSVNKERINQDKMDSTLANVETTILNEDLHECDIIIEAIIENVDIKKSLFASLGEITKKDSILASNTSSIPISILAEASGRQTKVVGMHFMNPVPIMKLVEIIRGYATSDDTCSEIMSLSSALGKSPVEVNDYPGFVANRILMPMINEAIITLNEGVAGVSEIDTVMKLGMAHPMGPLQLADFIGLDICLSIMRVLHDGLGSSKYMPCPLLVNMVMAGKLGAKSGEGFYLHTRGSKEITVSPFFA